MNALRRVPTREAHSRTAEFSGASLQRRLFKPESAADPPRLGGIRIITVTAHCDALQGRTLRGTAQDLMLGREPASD